MAERKPLFLSADGFSEEMSPTGDTATFAGLSLNGPIDMQSSKITNLADGSAATDAVNKQQLDNAVTGLDKKESVRLATAGSLPANTPAGVGVGKTLTGNANGALTVDGVAVNVGDRVMVKDEASTIQHGIYVVTQTGDALNPFILTRAADFDDDFEVTANAYAFVAEGTNNSDTGWVVNTNDPITVDTTGITWVQFTGLGQVTAGTGLSKVGDTLNVNAGDGIEILSDNVTVDLSATPGLELVGVTPNAELQVLVDPNGGLERVAAGVGVKLDGTTLQKGAAGLKVRGLPALFEVSGLAVGASVTAPNLDTLTDGSSADALHFHTAVDESERVENSLAVDAAVAAGDPVYISSANRVSKADAGTVATTKPVGVARTAQAVAGQTSEIVSMGAAAGVLSAASAGDRFYLAVGGGLTNSRPTGTGNRVIQMGFALNPTDLWVEIQDYGRLA